MKILLFISTLTLIHAKDIRLIDNQTGNPIKNVNVYTDKDGTTTDENGFCSLELFNEMDDITFSMIGRCQVHLVLLQEHQFKLSLIQTELFPFKLLEQFVPITMRLTLRPLRQGVFGVDQEL